ncbi:MFS transporter [Pantanalinema rosaneae CENA516]|uniref:MFS transporter n=1 Tax=Pantanalinema rosaneae TaxID=1620701 RepID=UPI003D6E1DBD
MTNSLTEETMIIPSQEISEASLVWELSIPRSQPTQLAKAEIRSSLRASTLDGVFATIFTNITGGVLLSNFLVELHATPFQIGMLASIPMMANLLQPLGAYWSDRTTSRRWYGAWVYGISRILWLPLAIAIIGFSWHPLYPQQMIMATLAVLSVTHVLGAIGSASWLAWLAALVPRQLRGRYFGFRNSTFSLTSLVAIPLLGLIVSRWAGGTIQGFGVMVLVGVVAGFISLGFQACMVDVNPQVAHIVEIETLATSTPEINISSESLINEATSAIAAVSSPAMDRAHTSIVKNQHFLLFLLYGGLWAFGANLSNPFFNLYLLDNLSLNLSWVTLYNGLDAGANLLMLMLWGKLADRIGNRPILLFVGALVALIPLFWLGTGNTAMSIWLWFPLLHLLSGGTWAAINLCMNNLQLAIAPMQHQTKYFAVTAAIGGVCGAVGTMFGGWLIELAGANGMMQLFAISSGLRVVALLPLLWLQEPQSHSLLATLQRFLQPVKYERFGIESAEVPIKN